MRKQNEDVYFNKIFIIQSLTTAERRTGDEIELQIKYLSYRGVPIDFELMDVSTTVDLFCTLDNISRLVSTGILPFIHFEVHGSKMGLILNSGELVAWEKFKDILVTINKKTKNNLFISLATCYGAHLLKIYKPWAPCPFYGYIGPTEEIDYRDLEVSFVKFFEVLLTENDFGNAIVQLQRTVDGNSGKYAFLNCYGYFERLVELYRLENNSFKKRNERIKDITRVYKEQYPGSRLTKREIMKQAERLILTGAEEEEIMKMRKIFLHL